MSIGNVLSHLLDVLNFVLTTLFDGFNVWNMKMSERQLAEWEFLREGLESAVIQFHLADLLRNEEMKQMTAAHVDFCRKDLLEFVVERLHAD